MAITLLLIHDLHVRGGKGTQLEDRGKHLEVNEIPMQSAKGYSLVKELFSSCG